uniref:Uncharacterized protein n=1 Tax=Candidatus Kentrum sp. TC TaxID=2126339 RepID=A0A450Z8E8_9GAMM|nr:MAG: hypothetical protein BECKTC1821D_GA0114238_108811 [Candidatus Kentron sp. TC]
MPTLRARTDPTRADPAGARGITAQAPASFRRKNGAIRAHGFEPLLDYLAKLRVNQGLVIAMTTGPDDSGALPDIASVLFYIDQFLLISKHQGAGIVTRHRS